MGGRTTKKSETDEEGRKKMVKFAIEVMNSKDWSHLQGRCNDESKCADKALREEVAKKMGWDWPPSRSFLFEELCRHRERANAPEKKPSKRGAPRARSPPPAKRSASDVVTACLHAADAVEFNDVTLEATIKEKKAIITAFRACHVRFNTSDIALAADPVAAATALLDRVAGWPDDVLPPSHIGDFFAKVAAMSDANRSSLIERTAEAERKRLGHTSAAPPPPPEPPVVATAKASSPFDEWQDDVELAEKALKGEKVEQASGGRSKEVEVRRIGDTNWRKFAGRADAARAFSGLTASKVSLLCNGKGGKELRLKYEARDVSGSLVPINIGGALRPVFDGLCLRFDTARINVADATGYASEVSSSIDWRAIGQSRPKDLLGVVQRCKTLKKEEWLKLGKATGEAEAARVLQTKTATLAGTARVELNSKRRDGTAGGDGVDEDYDFERAEREDREAELDRLRKTDAPDWMQRVAEDEIKARRRRAWWRKHKQRVGSPNDYFASL